MRHSISISTVSPNNNYSELELGDVLLDLQFGTVWQVVGKDSEHAKIIPTQGGPCLHLTSAHPFLPLGKIPQELREPMKSISKLKRSRP